jgi:bifunctional DNase/RNase
MSHRTCYLSQILIDEQADQQMIFLAERDGTRRVPITIGPLEAMAIDRAVKGQRFARPLTHDLLVQLIERSGHHCTAVRIVDLKEGTFYAQVELRTADGGNITLDCRPSDAIALLVRLPGAELTVAEAVLAEAGV